MQYCDMGTLDAAIKEGVFKDPKTGLPNLVGLRAGGASTAGFMFDCVVLCTFGAA